MTIGQNPIKTWWARVADRAVVVPLQWRVKAFAEYHFDARRSGCCQSHGKKLFKEDEYVYVCTDILVY